MSAGKLAPDIGQELQLIADGSKRFAVIEHRKDPAQYYAAGALSLPGVSVQYVTGVEGPEVIIARRRADIETYNRLLADGVQRLGIKQYHRNMGALFGYSPADIEAYITADIVCDCSKCKGLPL